MAGFEALKLLDLNDCKLARLGKSQSEQMWSVYWVCSAVITARYRLSHRIAGKGCATFNFDQFKLLGIGDQQVSAASSC